jgi:hypothetical protein
VEALHQHLLRHQHVIDPAVRCLLATAGSDVSIQVRQPWCDRFIPGILIQHRRIGI